MINLTNSPAWQALAGYLAVLEQVEPDKAAWAQAEVERALDEIEGRPAPSPPGPPPDEAGQRRHLAELGRLAEWLYTLNIQARCRALERAHRAADG